MSKDTPGSNCDPKTASTLAAFSITKYFQDKNWKIISFFPNSPCAHKAYPKEPPAGAAPEKDKK